MSASNLAKHQSATHAWEWAYNNTWADCDCSMVLADGRCITFTWEHPKTNEHGIMNALSNPKYGLYEVSA